VTVGCLFRRFTALVFLGGPIDLSLEEDGEVVSLSSEGGTARELKSAL
jgi:hypothetical protein